MVQHEGKGPHGRSGNGAESGPKYPDCEVRLVGADGNAFAILGTVNHALRSHLLAIADATVAENEAKAFFEEATAGDYDQLLQTCMRWVTVV